MHRRYFRTAADALQITIFNKLPGGFLRLIFGHAQKPGYPLPWLVHPCTSQGMSLHTANSFLHGTTAVHGGSDRMSALLLTSKAAASPQQSTTPTQASGYVVLIRWLQSALIPFVTTQSVGVCCSHKVVAVGFNTLCYDAKRRGIKPSARIKRIPLLSRSAYPTPAASS